MHIERLENESMLDYHKRIIYGKLVDKTLADVDYAELSELAYGRPYSSDTARRMFYGSQKTLELVDSIRDQSVEYTQDDESPAYDKKQAELRKDTQRFYDQRREYNKTLSYDGRKEWLYKQLADAAARLPLSVGRVYNTGHIVETDEEIGSETGNEAVLVFGDWHYGMVTNNVFNKYDTNICVDRVKTVVNSAIDRIRLHRCGKLHIVILGDMIHGAIHVSARVASEELVCDQLMQASELLAQSVYELSLYADSTYVYTTYGNHARTVQLKNDNIHRDNMERIIPWWMKQRFLNVNNIHVIDDNDTEILHVNVCGHDLCAVHGDLDSIKQSARLFPTLLQKRCGYNVEYILLGDKHHMESFEELGVTSILCGSLCGTDDYANDKRLFSTPCQLLLIFDNNGLDAEYRLRC